MNASSPRRASKRGPSAGGYRKVAVPAYLARFRCIGPACEDTCCAGWQLPVDRAAYNRFQYVRDSAFRAELLANCKPDPKPATEEAFAWIQLDPQGSCHFLTTDRWCSLQQRAGAGMLPATCADYPRTTVTTGEVWQRGATLSCPEAARLALLEDGAFAWERIEEPASARAGNTIRMLPETYGRDMPGRYAVAVRSLVFDLLSEGSVSIEARLLALGMALQRLDGAERVDRAAIEHTFQAYRDSLGDIESQVVGLRPRQTLQLELLRELTLERLATWVGHRPPRYMGCVQRMADALGLRADQAPSDGTLRVYGEARSAYYEPYVADHPFVLRNFVLNQVLITTFPFAAERTMFDQYVLLLVRFALVKMHLIGVSAYHHELTDALVVEVIQSFQRVVDHDHTFLNHIHELLRKNDVNSMAFMAVLLVS